ncbi:DNA polymerase III subunit delta' [Myxosarcina sp. GI1]|uniref:DNA polymerase III subunit delta' n=1 Tax=Myxosarcina sp. GI1 TaxID=1541065 RepID=UPI00068CF7DE|nr:DNA polymerase III subunit delta' [Myxosarcina sp. GI1]
MDAFANLIGQDRAVQFLWQAVKLNRIAPAYLFYGAVGIGKKIAVKSFAELLLTANLPFDKQLKAIKKIRAKQHPDLLWVQPTYLHKKELISVDRAMEQNLSFKTAPKIRIEQIRDITRFLTRHPLEASRQMVVIESTQTLTEPTANALLKTLEEPGNATIVLLALDKDLLLPTLVSRCQHVQFYRLSESNLATILQREGYSEILEHSELMEIAQGSPGQAIASWQQLQQIDRDLLRQLLQPPQSPLEAFKLAKTINAELDLTAQLWLIDYLQNYYWQQGATRETIEHCETARQYLNGHVQPRLVWECLLLSLVNNKLTINSHVRLGN